MPFPGHPVKTDDSSTVMLVPLLQGTLTNSVAVNLVAQGNENALGFSVTFDPALVRFAKANLGISAPSGTALVANTNQAASGTVGFLVGLVHAGHIHGWHAAIGPTPVRFRRVLQPRRADFGQHPDSTSSG